ncbi:MAG: serine--tRNA ligase [Bacteroidales bacterium]
MLSLRYLSENRDLVIKRLKVKNFQAAELVDRIMELDLQRRKIKNNLDNSQAAANKLSKQIGKLFQTARKEEAQQAREKTIALKEEIGQLIPELGETEKQLKEFLLQLPNIPHESVPEGKTPDNNQLIRDGGVIPELYPGALPHWELARKYDIIDFELGNKVTGAGFPVYKGKGARLQRGLINFFLDEATKAGYTEIIPPILVNEDSAFGTGQLPDKEGQMYHVQDDNFYLIPTAEVPLTNIYRREIIPFEDLPRKLTAYTPCFRREAGSYGKDVRGLNRLHQFDKVEIVEIQHPSRSYESLEAMTSYVESLVSRLQLPYRIVLLCGGDMSFHSAKTYDFEVFSGAQKKWLEVSSVSNFESFQSNRMMLRFREEVGKKTDIVHTLNGSALALPRIMAALLENNQSEKGIRIPSVLLPYTGFEVIDL